MRPVYLVDDHVLALGRRDQGQVIAVAADVLGHLVDLGLGAIATQPPYLLEGAIARAVSEAARN